MFLLNWWYLDIQQCFQVCTACLFTVKCCLLGHQLTFYRKERLMMKLKLNAFFVLLNVVFRLFCTLHFRFYNYDYDTSQRAFVCSKLTIETLEQGVKYVQS